MNAGIWTKSTIVSGIHQNLARFHFKIIYKFRFNSKLNIHIHFEVKHISLHISIPASLSLCLDHKIYLFIPTPSTEIPKQAPVHSLAF